VERAAFCPPQLATTSSAYGDDLTNGLLAYYKLAFDYTGK
jgi:hypothetical protein